MRRKVANGGEMFSCSKGKLWITVNEIDCPIEKFEKHIEQEV